MQLAVAAYVVLCVATLLVALSWWRVFNKARRSGILLIWGPLQTALWPWLTDPDPWLVLMLLGFSLVVSVAVTSTFVSIIGRPWWWVLPVVLGFLPQLVAVIWAMQASAVEELPDSLALFALGCWTVVVLLGVPLYLVGMFDLGDAFGFGIGFRLGLVFLPMVFLPVLAFGPSRYGDWGRVERERAKARAEKVMSDRTSATGLRGHPGPGEQGHHREVPRPQPTHQGGLPPWSGVQLPPLGDQPAPVDPDHRGA